MVVGRTSNYAEGFKSFTADDELMLANLKQALNYSAESLAIPDSNLKMPSKNNNKTNNIMPTMPDMEAIPTIPLMPTMSSMPTMPKIPPMPTNKATMANIMPNATVPMTTSSMSAGESFRNVKQVMNKSKLNSEDDTDDEDAVLDEEEYPSFQKKGKSGKGGKGGKSNEDDEDRDDIEEYEDIKEEDDEDREYNELKRKSLTRRQHKSKESIEGFRGSAEIEGRTLKNILLALLLSFIGYLVVYASINNYLPITEISPQLKKFKHLVYGGIFFILAYICLEVF
jgi:hypothetical protein